MKKILNAYILTEEEFKKACDFSYDCGLKKGYGEVNVVRNLRDTYILVRGDCEGLYVAEYATKAAAVKKAKELYKTDPNAQTITVCKFIGDPDGFVVEKEAK